MFCSSAFELYIQSQYANENYCFCYNGYSLNGSSTQNISIGYIILIFWMIMRCGIARFGQRGQKKQNLKILVSKFVPRDLKGWHRGFKNSSIQELLHPWAQRLLASPSSVQTSSLSILGKKIFFSEMVQEGQDGPKRVPNGQKHLGWPFWSLLDPFGPLWSVDKPAMFGPFWSKMDHF